MVERNDRVEKVRICERCNQIVLTSLKKIINMTCSPAKNYASFWDKVQTLSEVGMKNSWCKKEMKIARFGKKMDPCNWSSGKV